jgi:hypothetical protein
MRRLAVSAPAVILVVVTHMALGAGWYAAFEEPWLDAIGKKASDFEAVNPAIYALPVIAAIGGLLLVAWIMSLRGDNTPGGGVLIGLAVWAATVGPFALVHNAFSGFPLDLTLIDGTVELLSFVTAGLIIGASRRRHVPASVVVATR